MPGQTEHQLRMVMALGEGRFDVVAQREGRLHRSLLGGRHPVYNAWRAQEAVIRLTHSCHGLLIAMAQARENTVEGCP